MIAKLIFTVTFILCLCNQINGNPIDTLKTDSDVDVFLAATFYKNIYTVHRFDSSEFYNQRHFIAYDSLGIKNSWFKSDINHNGQTDLIVTLVDTIYDGNPKLVAILTSIGGNGHKMKTIKTDYSKAYFVKNLSINKEFKFMTVNINAGYQNKPLEIDCDTLKYHEHTFINYNPKIEKHKITKIEFETTRCYGRCPAFKLEITNKKMLFEGISYNSEVGHFTAKTDKRVFKQISNLLKQSNFTSFKDNYYKNISDSPTYYIKIWYDNGKCKTIKDYPGQGNVTLMNIYTKLFTQKYLANWE